MIPSSRNEKANAGTIYNVHSKLGNSFTDRRKGLLRVEKKANCYRKLKSKSLLVGISDLGD